MKPAHIIISFIANLVVILFLSIMLIISGNLNVIFGILGIIFDIYITWGVIRAMKEAFSA